MKLRVLLCALLLVGCGRAIQAKPVAGFVEIHDDPTYDYRAVAPEGVAVAARLVKLQENQPTDVAFWERAVTLRMREMEGYALLESKDVTGGDGSRGRELAFGHDEQGKPYLYRVRVFTSSKKLLVVEAGGTKEQMEKMASNVDAMLAQLKLP